MFFFFFGTYWEHFYAGAWWLSGVDYGVDTTAACTDIGEPSEQWCSQDVRVSRGGLSVLGRLVEVSLDRAFPARLLVDLAYLLQDSWQLETSSDFGPCGLALSSPGLGSAGPWNALLQYPVFHDSISGLHEEVPPGPAARNFYAFPTRDCCCGGWQPPFFRLSCSTLTPMSFSTCRDS